MSRSGRPIAISLPATSRHQSANVQSSGDRAECERNARKEEEERRGDRRKWSAGYGSARPRRRRTCQPCRSLIQFGSAATGGPAHELEYYCRRGEGREMLERRWEGTNCIVLEDSRKTKTAGRKVAHDPDGRILSSSSSLRHSESLFRIGRSRQLHFHCT